MNWGRRAVASAAAFLLLFNGCVQEAYASNYIFPAPTDALGMCVRGMKEVGERGRFTVYYEPYTIEEQIQEEIYEGEREELAILVMAEAGNQSLEGKRLVADVVLNRVADPAFPDSIHEVIFQEGQFAVIKNGAYEKAEWTVTDECFEAVRLETECEQLNSDVLYFTAGKYGSFGTPAFVVGNHYFCTK